MGEEYGEIAPFQYFVSHADPDLVEAVRRGRADESADFRAQGTPPDPNDVATFANSRLRHELRGKAPHRAMRSYYKELLRLRRNTPALAELDKDAMEVCGSDAQQVLAVRRWAGPSEALLAMNFGGEDVTIRVPGIGSRWRLALCSADTAWEGPGHTLPATLDSTGSAQLPGKTLALYIKNEKNEEAAL